MPRILDHLKRLQGRAADWKPVRVLAVYSRNRGQLLAAGLSFNAIFAASAALWLGFAIGGLVLKAQPTLRGAVFAFIDRAVPGLIDIGAGGAIDAAELLQGQVLGWTGAVAVAGLLLTALGWLAAARSAIRVIFGLARPRANPVVLRLKDAGLAVAFGLAVLVSAALTVVGTQALGLIATLLPSASSESAARMVGLGVMFLFDAAVLASLFRILAGIRLPFRRLLGGVLLGAVGLGVLKILGGRLLIVAVRNPLLASFTVILGLMIWFNLMSQVILLAASWVAVDAEHQTTAEGRAY